MRVRGARIHAHGGLDQLVVERFDLGEPGPDEVVVRLRAAALNHLDLFVLEGIPGIDMPLPHVMGGDGAGVVDAVGNQVDSVARGDEVVLNPGVWCQRCEFCVTGEQSMCTRYQLFGEHRDGTFAEAIVAPARNCYPKPPRLDWPQAAAFPLVGLTAWRMLVTNAGVGPGQTVLIHGIGGGVSLMALQIALAAGARVFVTSHARDKLDRALEIGAAEAWDYNEVDVAREVRRVTAKRGVDVVVDSVGEATFDTSIRACRKSGCIVTCGGTSGPKLPVDVRYLFWNHLRILGSTMGNESDFRRMLAAVSDGRIDPVVDSVHALDDVVGAFEALENADQFGKIVVDVG